jgi:hypothetical protein
MKNIITLITGLILSFAGFAQNCLPEGITFTTQEQIDNFQADYPGCTKILGFVKIDGDNDITNLNGLSSIAYIFESLDVFGNPALTSLTGLDNLEVIGGYLNIAANPVLTSLEGLHNLHTIGIHSDNNYLSIVSNNALTNLAGLENLTTLGIAGYITINSSISLTSLAGIDNISPGSVKGLSIFMNDNLSDCVVKSICDYLVSPNGYVLIYMNTTGCDSEEEAKAACVQGIDEPVVGGQRSAVGIYPSPSYSKITIEIPGISSQFPFSIFDVSGQVLICGQVTEPQTLVDIASLAPGIYFVRVTTDRTVLVGKFVKR